MNSARAMSALSTGPLKLLFFGPPGVGKGTFASLANKLWRLPHISTGDMIRAEMKTGSSLGKQFRDYNDRGALVPDQLVCAIAEKRLSERDVAKGYILDGFPRTTMQAEHLEKFSPSSMCVNFVMPEKLLVQKLAGRRVCGKCGKNYNVANIQEGNFSMAPLLPKKEGICDDCGSDSIIQRADDKEEVILKRLAVYRKETAPLIDFYVRRGILQTFGVTRGIEDFDAVAEMIKSVA